MKLFFKGSRQPCKQLMQLNVDARHLHMHYIKCSFLIVSLHLETHISELDDGVWTGRQVKHVADFILNLNSFSAALNQLFSCTPMCSRTHRNV